MTLVIATAVVLAVSDSGGEPASVLGASDGVTADSSLALASIRSLTLLSIYWARSLLASTALIVKL